MGWVQVLVAVVALVREILKYLNEKEETKQIKIQKVNDVKSGIKKARKEGDTSEIEAALASLGLVNGKSNGDGLSNDTN
jgi:hypothetical protein